MIFSPGAYDLIIMSAVKNGHCMSLTSCNYTSLDCHVHLLQSQQAHSSLLPFPWTDSCTSLWAHLREPSVPTRKVTLFLWNKIIIKLSLCRGVNYCILWYLLIIQSLFVCIMFARNQICWLGHFSCILKQGKHIKCFLQAAVYFNLLSRNWIFFFF